MSTEFPEAGKHGVPWRVRTEYLGKVSTEFLLAGEYRVPWRVSTEYRGRNALSTAFNTTIIGGEQDQLGKGKEKCKEGLLEHQRCEYGAFEELGTEYRILPQAGALEGRS